jgi:DNA-binding MarR family transcriptional regulator
MSRKEDAAPDSSPSTTGAERPVLDAEQQETWLAWMRVQLRLSHELNRQLQRDSGLSLADYHVLNALADSPGHRLQLSDLAARISWERSRLSHHLQRMGERGLVERVVSTTDRRATDAVLTDAGEAALVAATPAHAVLIRTVFFDQLDPALVAPLRTALEQIHEQLLVHGTLPAPGPPQRRLTGLEVEN